MGCIQKMQAISNKKLLITFITLLILNSICIIVLASKNGAYNLDGSYSAANSSGLIIMALMGVVISIPLVISLLSALIAIFINKQQSYGKRFVRTFLFVIVVAYSITFVRFLYNIILNN
jgi:ABC-type sugar transport system permease subunit